MSNVTGEAVADVASYMTAIWNNFDGTYDQLEKYADVITALGAATASSSEEIAGGLEQFASIAQTVGLSYEYATSALATVVATTRQSEDLVGTAFRTIFSRLQGLSLGDTLEDGTDLNKYSTALHKVGVEILDTSGSMKDLDTILDDLAEKWDNLSSAQKTALAQTVAGTQRYSQLIALMDNWDFMEENLATAKNAEGALSEQAETYEESWEAARKRVKAAAQAIYTDLIDEDFFISITNGTEKILNGVDTFIDKMGGVKSILTLVASLFMTQYSTKIPTFLKEVSQNLMVITGQANKLMIKTQNENIEYMQKQAQVPGISTTRQVSLEKDIQLAKLQQKYNVSQNLMTQEEQESFRIKKQNVEASYDEAINIAKQVDLLKEKVQQEKQEAILREGQKTTKIFSDYEEAEAKVSYQQAKVDKKEGTKREQRQDKKLLEKYQLEAKEKETAVGIVADQYNIDYDGDIKSHYTSIKNVITDTHKEFESLSKSLSNYSKIENTIASGSLWKNQLEGLKANSKEFDNFKEKIKNFLNDSQEELNVSGENLFKNFFSSEIEDLSNIDSVEKLESFFESLQNKFSDTDLIEGVTELEERNTQNAELLGADLSDLTEQQIEEEQRLREQREQTQNQINKIDTQVRAHISILASETASALMSVGTLISQYSSVYETFSKEDSSALEKMISLTSFLSTSIITLNSVTRVRQSLAAASAAWEAKLAAVSAEEAISAGASAAANTADATAKGAATAATISLKAAIDLLKNSTLFWTLAITAAVAALAALYKWVMSAKKEIESTKDALSRVTEEVENLTSTFEEAENQVKSFKETVSNYDDAVDALKDLTKGTEDYKEKVEEANEKAKELIETYGLYDSFEYSNDGVLTLKEGHESDLSQAREKLKRQENSTSSQLALEKMRQASLQQKAYLEKNNQSSDAELLIGTAQQQRDEARKKFLETPIFSTKLEAQTKEKALAIPTLSEDTPSFVSDLSKYQVSEEENVLKLGNVVQSLGDSEKDFVNQLKTYNSTLEYQAKSYLQGQVDSGKSDVDAAIAGLVTAFDKGYVSDLSKIVSSDVDFSDLVSEGIVKEGASFEEVVKKYAEEIQGWTEEEISSAEWDKKNNTLTSGDKVLKAKEKNIYEGLYQRQAAADLTSRIDLSQYGEVINAIQGITSSEQDSLLNSFKNATEEGIVIDSAELSPESVEKIKSQLEEAANEGVGKSFEEALENYDPEKYYTAQDEAHSANVDTQISNNGLDSDAIKTQTQLIQENVEALENDEIAAKQLVVNNTLMNKGLETLIDNWEDWSSVLKSSDKTSSEYASTLKNLKSVLGKLSGIGEELAQNLSADFFDESNLDLLERAAKADEDAINDLSFAVGENLISNLEASDSYLADLIENGKELDGAFEGLNFSSFDEFSNYFEDIKSQVVSSMEQIQSAVSNGTLQMGSDLSSAFSDPSMMNNFIENLNKMSQAMGWSLSDYNNYLSSLGVEANVKETLVDDPDSEFPVYQTEVTRVGGDDSSLPGGDLFSGTWTTQTYLVDQQPVEGAKRAVASITYDGSDPRTNISYVGRGHASSGNTSKAKKSSGGSSGGGGSSSKPKTKDHKEKISEEAELYHDVKESIEDLTHQMNLLNKAQEHLSGDELIKSLKAENELIEQQKQNYAEYTKQLKDRQNVLKTRLTEYGDPEDYYGTYSAIEAAYNAAIDTYNAAVDQYNAMSAEAQDETGEDILDTADKALEEAKDAYDDASKWLKEYYENVNQLRDNEETQLEDLYQQIENNLKAYTTEIELKLDTTEAKRSLEKFLKSAQQDIKNLYKTSDEWALEFGNSQVNADTYSIDIDTKKAQLERYKSIYANKQWGGKNDLFASESEAIQAIIDVEKELLEDSENLLNEYQTAYDNLRDAFSEVAEQFDDIIDEFETINDTLDHYEKVIELLHGTSTDLGMSELDQLYSLEAQNSLDKQSALKEYISALEERRDEALENGFDEDDSYIRDIEDKITSATSDLESEIESYIETIQSQLENSVNMAKSVMDQATWGNTLTNVQQEWDDKKEMAEGYYDEVERIYQLETLENKWQSAINSTNTLKYQQQLKDLMNAQVSALEEKTSLSEKDIELAEKEIEVYQAQIALEEAQNAKNTMKLTRDESGNWSYQYIADEDTVLDKQQDYLDKINEWRSSAMTAAEEIKESVLEAYTNFSERMAEIMSDATLSDEERASAIDELTETYYGEDGIITKAVEDSNYITQEANKATFIELWSLYDEDQDNYEQMTETEKSLVDDLTNQGISDYTDLRDFLIGGDKNSGVYGDILDTAKEVNKGCSQAWDSMAADAIERMYGKDGKLNKSSVTGIVQTAYSEMEKALDKYNEAIIESEEASGVEWSKVEGQLTAVSEQIDSVEGKIDELTGKINDLGAFESAVESIKQTWDDVGESITTATSDLREYLSLLYGGSSSGTSDTDVSSGEDEEDSSSNSAGDSSIGDGDLSIGDTATLNGSYYYDSTGTSPKGSKYSGVADGVIVDKINDKYGEYSYHIKSADGTYKDLGWVKKSQLSGYDTGGYTGEWNGGSGKLALLHSKELVLNQNDTSNLLNAVSAIREVSGLGNVSSSIASGVAAIVRNMLGFSLNTSGLGGISSSPADNNTFNITAEFPNASNVDDIREAILSLPNLASQYLSRKN